MVEIYLNDANMNQDQSELYFMRADWWAREHCSSYQGHHVQDVSDVSYTHDYVALYTFADDSDATLFKLKWAQ